ncbi:MAG: 1-acyl-sn-glycerol-3-phosphate acyltransferase, partial [Treponema sp.]|nr:1-acyl-sn-glycerol-3-phosphate acyltransferase [Treponema sp.]
EYDKAIYIDSDTIILGNIAEMYAYDLGDNYVGACKEQAMIQEDVFGTYVEKCLGCDRNNYFNAGVLLINCERFRTKRVLDQFIKLLHEYTFTVTQDEDYLNVICYNKVLWLPQGWDMEVYGELPCKPEEFKIIHYIMWSKPWHFDDCRLKEYFWKYAEQTVVYDEILEILKNYSEERKQKDMQEADHLAKLAIEETNRPDNYLNRQTLMRSFFKVVKALVKKSEVKQAEDRLRVLKKIDEYEIAGKFDQDVEDDPPARQLVPGEVDFEQKKLKTKIMALYAHEKARKFRNKMERQKKFIYKGIVGLENIKDFKGGAIVTCNHFNAFDSFVIEYVYEELKKNNSKSKFFRVIREGNYTNFPGFYGLLMRYCYTLPLSTNHIVINEFLQACGNLLKAGHFILIYPEQGMWWNYRKPRPMKKGTFNLAVKNNVPVLPCFITLEDSSIIDDNGFPVQEYTIHVGKPIYPKEGVKRPENMEYLMNENYAQWKAIYEDTYKIPLTYKTE